MPSLSLVIPIGTIIDSMLTEAQIQTYYGDAWVLCDGRSVSGSLYESITGNASIPDGRGRYKRFKDNAAGTDPNGDSSLGSARSSHNKAHQHDASLQNNGISGTSPVPIATQGGVGTTVTASPTYIQSNGNGDSQPLSIVVNCFIKIN